MKLTKFFAFALAALAVVGCGGDTTTNEGTGNGNGNNGENNFTPRPEGSITLTADKTSATVGETITFTVTDTEGQDLTAASKIYDQDMTKLANNTFTAEKTGSYTFFASCEGENSNVLAIKVVASMPDTPKDTEPDNFAFNHRAVLVDHTAVNCGYCTWMTDYLIAYHKTSMNKHYNEVTCHAGDLAVGDPAASTAATNLMTYHARFNGGFGNPTLIFNFKTGVVSNDSNFSVIKSNIDKVLNGYIKKDGADVGIAIATEGDSDAIQCAAEIKVAKDGYYFVNAWLLESDIWSPNQASATTAEHKTYNYALRNFSETVKTTTLGGIAGFEIGELKQGSKYLYGCELEILNNKWNWENMGVLVVVSALNDNGTIEVVNSAYCKQGETLTYDYL